MKNLQQKTDFLLVGIFFLGLCLIGSATEMRAQTTQQDRAQMARDMGTTPGPIVTTTGVDDTHVVTSPNDADLGEQQILKRTETYQPFVASVGVPFYWTSNVALTNSGEQSDFIVSPVAAIAYLPRINQNLSAYVSVRDQQFYYDRLTSFDFGSFDAEIGLTYTVRQVHNLVLHVGYDYNRLTKKNSFESFFNNHNLIVSAEIPLRLNRAQQFVFGIDTTISMTGDPDPPRRHDFDGYIGYSVQLTRALTLSATGRITIHDYVLGDRVDITEMIALNANYSIASWFSASALASFAANQSNFSVFDYNVGDAGGAVSFSIRF